MRRTLATAAVTGIAALALLAGPGSANAQDLRPPGDVGTERQLDLLGGTLGGLLGPLNGILVNVTGSG